MSRPANGIQLALVAAAVLVSGSCGTHNASTPSAPTSATSTQHNDQNNDPLFFGGIAASGTLAVVQARRFKARRSALGR